MPGIVGIIGPGKPEQLELELYQMLICSKHESSYTDGTYINNQIGIRLGWTAHQNSFSDEMPLWNERQDICLVFTGEEFSDSETIHSLSSKGHHVKPATGDYLIHLYEDAGDEFVERLNGRFSGLVIDLRQQKMVLFNDRFGLGRIYFFEKHGKCYFSSEAKSLLKIHPELRRLSYRSLAEAFSLGCVLQNRSLYSGVCLIPSGSKWTFSPSQPTKKERYFHTANLEARRRLDPKEYYEKLKQTWRRILPNYFGGRELIGLSLTGGKDSRMILAFASNKSGTMPCYTFGGLYRESMDVKLARKIAEICQQPFHTIIVDRDFLRDFSALAERAVFLTDGTMDVSGASELYVNRIARQLAPVRLTGNFAQEILHSSIAFKPMPFLRTVLRNDFRLFMDEAYETYQNELRCHPLTFVTSKQVPWHHYSRLSLELSQLTVRSPYLDNDLVALAYQAPSDPTLGQAMQLELIAEGNPDLGEIGTDRDLRLRPIPMVTPARHLYQEFMAKAEYAYDYGMPQWLSRLDYGIKSLHMERLFLGRQKFVHYRVWYRDQLSDYVMAILLDPRTLNRPYLDGSELERMVKAHIRGTGNYTLEIHRILTAELIHRLFID